MEITTYSDVSTYTEAPAYEPVITLHAGNETITSTLKATKTMLADTTVYEEPLSPLPTVSATQSADGEDSMGVVYKQKSGAGGRFIARSGHRWWGVGAGNMKFQMVFMFWPALVGIVVAL